MTIFPSSRLVRENQRFSLIKFIIKNLRFLIIQLNKNNKLFLLSSADVIRICFANSNTSRNIEKKFF